MGLAISKRLVEGMGGKIGVTSTEGKGSCFWFELPLLKVTEKSLETTLTVANSPDLNLGIFNVGVVEDSTQSYTLTSKESIAKQSQILLVEDNKINQKLAMVLLGKLGYQVDLAENGLEAINSTKSKRYDLILMDMQMPEMGGVDATRHIRLLDEYNAHVPIVALTANAMNSDNEDCIEAGMNDFLTKPINRDRLIRCLEKWL